MRLLNKDLDDDDDDDRMLCALEERLCVSSHCCVG